MHFAAICLIVKNEGPYLLEWIAYHRVVGFDFFYIYDNESTDGSAEMLYALEKEGILKTVHWPTVPGINIQTAAYNDALRRFGHECEWLAVIDADEFIVPHADGNIKEFLKSFPEDVGAVGINWKMFGSSGHVTKTPGLVMERFLRCSEEGYEPNHHIKSIMKPEFTKSAKVHRCYLTNSKRYMDPALRLITDSKHSHVLHEKIQVNHYFTKSKEEWNLKRARGNGDRQKNDPTKYRGEEEFYRKELSLDVDVKILYYLKPTLKEILKLESLPAFPKKQPAKIQGGIIGYLDKVHPQSVIGWARYQASNDPVPLELVVDGCPIAFTIANLFRPDLKEKKIGDGFSGFRFQLPASFGLKGGESLIVRGMGDTGSGLRGSPKVYSKEKETVT